MSEIKNEKLIKEQQIPISKEGIKMILFQMENCICKIYLKNDKIGIIANDTIYEPIFSGAAFNSNYVAVVKKGDTKDGTYYKEQDETIQFLEVEYNNSILIKHVSDSFYPYELNWFPIGFRNKYGLFVENVKDDNESGFFMNEENSYVNDYIDSPEDAIMRSLSGHGCDPELFGF